MLTVRYAW